MNPTKSQKDETREDTLKYQGVGLLPRLRRFATR
jgi:hypothetical protein